MAKKRSCISVSLEAKSGMDSVKSLGQSYDGIIRELVKSWKEKSSKAVNDKK